MVREEAMEEGKKVRRLLVSFEAMFEVFSSMQSGVIQLEGIPPDAKCLYAGTDHSTGCFVFMLEHTNFDFVPAGELPPTVIITCHQIRKGYKPRPTDSYSSK